MPGRRSLDDRAHPGPLCRRRMKPRQTALSDRSRPDPPSRGWRVFLTLVTALPQSFLSRGVGLLADLPLPPLLRTLVLRSFVAWTGADPGEAERPLGEYPSVGAFFVRRLRPGVRSWPDDRDVPASPVDGIVGELGALDGLTALQAKGRPYSVAQLLGTPEDGSRFDGGAFLTLYLSPRHYHRIHAPVSGRVTKAHYLPGRLLPVNAPAVAGLPELFPGNERLVCFLDSGLGQVAVVAVGALNVGRISAAFDPEWNRGKGSHPSVSNRGRARKEEVRRYSPPGRVTRGDELMAFHLGSTVVLLFEPGRITWEAPLAPGVEIRLGAPLGSGRPGP